MDGIAPVFLTLADIIAQISGDLALSPARRRDLISAVQRICEIVGVDPRVTPASLSYMQPLIGKVRPARHDLRPKTWSNLRANFRAALTAPLPRRPREPNPLWETLRRSLPDPYSRYRLSRFMRFCEREKISPAEVSDAVVHCFIIDLENSGQVWKPHSCLRMTCRLWNEAADTIPGWPQVRVSLPSHRRQRQTLPLTSYPRTLQQELQECLVPPHPADRFAPRAYRKALRASTIRQITTEVCLALSALVEAGRPPETMTSLTCLFEPDAFETVLRRYLNDDDEQTPRPTAHNLASSLIGLADRFFASDPAGCRLIAELRRLRKCLGPKPTGLTKKNRKLVLDLADPFLRAKLYALPEQLAAWAARATPIRGALAMQLGVAISILLVAPLRISNLAALRFDRHLRRPAGPRSLWIVDIPEEEVKNRVRLVHELPERVTVQLDRFRRDFRPRLAQPGNPYLFPVGSYHKDPAGLSQAIRRVIADWIGIDMTAHQFRHLAGLLMHDDLEALAILLGDTNTRTVRNHYAELNTLDIGRRFDAIIVAELERLGRPQRKR